MQGEVKKNENLEMIYQQIKKITAQTDLNGIVHKILSKDKEYNLAVSKVTENEMNIDITKKKISELKEQLVQKRNESI